MELDDKIDKASEIFNKMSRMSTLLCTGEAGTGEEAVGNPELPLLAVEID